MLKIWNLKFKLLLKRLGINVPGWAIFLVADPTEPIIIVDSKWLVGAVECPTTGLIIASSLLLEDPPPGWELAWEVSGRGLGSGEEG